MAKVAQLVEQRFVAPLVAGSIPVFCPTHYALMAELVDAVDSKSAVARRVGSSPTEGTTYFQILSLYLIFLYWDNNVYYLN